MPETLHSYLYGLNNPVLYTDPSGRCADFVTLVLCLTVIGIGVGIIYNYSSQVISNLNTGMSFWDAVYYKNINKKELTVASVRAGVGAFTFAVIAPVSFTGFVVTGCFATIGSGRAGALTDAGWEQVASLYQGNDISVSKFVQDAQKAGFLDGTQIILDGLSGGISGGLIYGLTSITPIAQPVKSPGGVPVIRLLPSGGVRIELSGRPGLHLPPTEMQKLGYGITNGLANIIRRILGNVIRDIAIRPIKNYVGTPTPSPLPIATPAPAPPLLSTPMPTP